MLVFTLVMDNVDLQLILTITYCELLTFLVSGTGKRISFFTSIKICIDNMIWMCFYSFFIIHNRLFLAAI
ncbi:hypothetical protein BDB00DRAFT_855086 [Zychaea mexicana]|uniref:uncharacterized protein n=1 Tax=Zychaea mexicana TaxID=64656 RepID=UPI0022FF0B4C|nr:uncharacterized protein BDB00DRAFT_855086 [Zychaea mexicana]KAI9484531.1 hypothetical protein BDB00DRAFT_855086 [Zychaea mexicana]